MWKRLLRLWKLSEFDILMPKELPPPGSLVAIVVKRPQQLAKIVKTIEPVDEFLEEPKQL